MSDRPSATDMQPTLCSVAKRMASEHFGIRLDLSARSVRSVEKILGAIHKEHLKSRAEAAFDGIALEYAAYIVEVIQGHFGPALWQRDCPREGVDTFPLYWRNEILYPYAWCQKRIYQGAADDVWSRFSNVVLGKSARRWWQPFGRRLSDVAGGTENNATAGPGIERRTRHHDEDRRQLPGRDGRPQGQDHRDIKAVASADDPRHSMDDGLGPLDQQAAEVLEVSDVLSDGALDLAGVAIVEADRPPRRRSGSTAG